MVRIAPIQYTDRNILATQLKVVERNPTDVSVDAVWELYADSGEEVDNGVMQLAGDDFIAYNDNPDYLYTYVANNPSKPLTILL